MDCQVTTDINCSYQYLGDSNINVTYNLKSRYNIVTQTYSISGKVFIEKYPFTVSGDIYNKVELKIDKINLSTDSNGYYAQRLFINSNQLNGYHIQIDIPTKLVIFENHYNKNNYNQLYNDYDSYLFVTNYNRHTQTDVFYCNIDS